MKHLISGILIITGVAMMAGSAGDCDGKCMEQANTLGEMIMYASMGLALMITGGFIAFFEKN